MNCGPCKHVVSFSLVVSKWHWITSYQKNKRPQFRFCGLPQSWRLTGLQSLWGDFCFLYKRFLLLWVWALPAGWSEPLPDPPLRTKSAPPATLAPSPRASRVTALARVVTPRLSCRVNATSLLMLWLLLLLLVVLRSWSAEIDSNCFAAQPTRHRLRTGATPTTNLCTYSHNRQVQKMSVNCIVVTGELLLSLQSLAVSTDIC